MSITANSQLPNLLSKNLKSITSKVDNTVPPLGSELVYTQDTTGDYLTFYWSAGDRLGINSEQIIGDLNRDEIFAPVEKVAYLQRLGRIVKNVAPERCQCWFSYRQELFELELVISPIMPTLGTAATTVLVMGRLLQTKSNKKAVHLPAPQPTELELALSSHQYQKLVSQITRNIRRTLDLDIIWQQTVDSLGKALGLERCIICPYEKESAKVSIIAEYHKPNIDSMLGLEIDLATEPAFAQALATLEPIVENKPKHMLFGQEKILVVATCHQDQPNA